MKNKTVVCVVFHDRLKNLIRWLEVWKKINPKNAELRIIHNVHPNESIDNFKSHCLTAGVTYIPRINKPGMDIGAFQDVCRSRLNGFKNDFEYIIWLTDDTFPMRATFIEEFIFHLSNSRVGLTCYEISPQVKKHVRTTGFCVRYATLNQIIFDVDPIRTKDDCWNFEHRSHRSLYNQIISMGYEVVQLSHVNSSPVWDSGGGGIKWADREEEFLNYWKIDRPPAKVVVIAPCFNRYPEIVSSMLCQTYKNWELHLIHDGPATFNYPKFNDDRIIFKEMPTRRKEWCHPIRIDYLNLIKSQEIKCDYVVVTNDDNHHVPHYLEKLIKPLEENKNYIGSYCSMMVHNYAGNGTEIIDPEIGHAIDGYGVIHTKPEQGYIDCAAALIRSEVAGREGWPSTRHSSDWDYLNTIAVRNGGWNKFAVVFGALLVHN